MDLQYKNKVAFASINAKLYFPIIFSIIVLINLNCYRPVATVLVLQGTLRKGFVLVCGSVWAQARSLHNERGTLISEAPPSIPVLVSGWKDLPQIGQECLQVRDLK